MKSLFKLFMIIIIFIVSLFVIYYSWGNIFRVNYQTYTVNEFYSGIIGSILAGFVAAFLAWVAWEQWSNINTTSSADFFHRLTKDFFTPETRTLMSLIECKALNYIEPYAIPDY